MQVFIFYIPLTCLKGVTNTYTNGISSAIKTLLLIEITTVTSKLLT